MVHRPLRRFVVVALLLGACSSSGDGDRDTSGGEDAMGSMDEEPVVEHRGSAIETIGITPPDRPWAEMSASEREWYMVGKVLPIMNELFQRQYPSRYPESGITCETCHGEDGQSRGFAMPSGHLMPLPAPGTPAAESLSRRMPESIEFMSETVTPTMKTLLGVDELRCSACHTRAP